MRVYKTKEFARTSRKENVSDAELLKAAKRAFEGKTDADLGAHLVKQHVSQGTGGRSDGHRAIIVHVEGERVTFVHLFAKSDKASLSTSEMRTYKKLAKSIAALSEGQINLLLEAKEWIEIKDDQKQRNIQE